MPRDHLLKWRDHEDESFGAAAHAGWRSDRDRTTGLVRSTYGHVARGTPVWRHADVFEVADGPLAL